MEVSVQWRTPARRKSVMPIVTAAQLRAALPCTTHVSQLVHQTQASLSRILRGQQDRLAVIVGPCSIHERESALDFARRLAALRIRYADTLEIVMRVYFEKPRTTLGWKGWINDPDLDGTFRVEEGLRGARRLLLDIGEAGLPAATEFLDLMTVAYLEDLVAWGAIGARTTESQIHRQIASGLAAPIGFKNGTDGNVRVAIDAVRTARAPHHFLAPSDTGPLEVHETFGNPDGHVVLRGGKATNYDSHSVDDACRQLREAGLPPCVVVDASHGNSGKQARGQILACEDIGRQIRNGRREIAGVMLESHLVEGRQDVQTGRSLIYGQSITDACLGWTDTVDLIDYLAACVTTRRQRDNATVHTTVSALDAALRGVPASSMPHAQAAARQSALS